ncbi:MAG: CoA ester lyase [Paracoccaceae bacterium]|nr:CoA ester lyase [Paracoccaceae bacterium]
MGVDFLCRSVLYIPGSKERALEKARSLPVDVIIFDLEDAVAPDEKVAARQTLAAELAKGGYRRRKRIVRINGLTSPWGRDDAKAVADMACDAVLLPKTETAADVSEVTEVLPDLAVWCMLETPRGVLNALEIADHPAVEGFVMGTNDLAKDIGCATGGDRLALMTSLQMCLLAARSAGVACVDGVYNAFKDEAGLEAECQQGLALGMDGKTLIHPAQIDIANRVFAPTEAQIDLANRQIEAFEAAEAKGEGVAVVDGSIVENLHIVTARSVLAKAAAIRESEVT